MDAVTEGWKSCTDDIEDVVKAFLCRALGARDDRPRSSHEQGESWESHATMLWWAIERCTDALDGEAGIHAPMPLHETERWGSLGCTLWNATPAPVSDSTTSLAMLRCCSVARCLAAVLFVAGNMFYGGPSAVHHRFLMHHPTVAAQCVLMCSRAASDSCSLAPPESGDTTLPCGSKAAAQPPTRTFPKSGSERAKWLYIAERLVREAESLLAAVMGGRSSETFPLVLRVCGSAHRFRMLDDARWESRFAALALHRAQMSATELVDAAGSMVQDLLRIASAPQPSASMGSESPSPALGSWGERKESLLRFIFFAEGNPEELLGFPECPHVAYNDRTDAGTSQASGSRVPPQEVTDWSLAMARLRILSLDLQRAEWRSAGAVGAMPPVEEIPGPRRVLAALTNQQIAQSLLRAGKATEALQYAKAAIVLGDGNDTSSLLVALRCSMGTQDVDEVRAALQAYTACVALTLDDATAACYEVHRASTEFQRIACVEMASVFARCRGPSAEKTALLFHYIRLVYTAMGNSTAAAVERRERLQEALLEVSSEAHIRYLSEEMGCWCLHYAVSLIPQTAALTDESGTTRRSSPCSRRTDRDDDVCTGTVLDAPARPSSVFGQVGSGTDDSASTGVNTICCIHVAVKFAEMFAGNEERSALLCALAEELLAEFQRNSGGDHELLQSALEAAMRSHELQPRNPFATALLFQLCVLREDKEQAMRHLHALQQCEPQELVVPALCSALNFSLQTSVAADACLTILQYLLLSHERPRVLHSGDVLPPSEVVRTTASSHVVSEGAFFADVELQLDLLQLLYLLMRDRRPRTVRGEFSASQEELGEVFGVLAAVAERLRLLPVMEIATAGTVDGGNAHACLLKDDQLLWWGDVLFQDGCEAMEAAYSSAALALLRAASFIAELAALRGGVAERSKALVAHAARLGAEIVAYSQSVEPAGGDASGPTAGAHSCTARPTLTEVHSALATCANALNSASAPVSTLRLEGTSSSSVPPADTDESGSNPGPRNVVQAIIFVARVVISMRALVMASTAAEGGGALVSSPQAVAPSAWPVVPLNGPRETLREMLKTDLSWRQVSLDSGADAEDFDYLAGIAEMLVFQSSKDGSEREAVCAGAAGAASSPPPIRELIAEDEDLVLQVALACHCCSAEWRGHAARSGGNGTNIAGATDVLASHEDALRRSTEAAEAVASQWWRNGSDSLSARVEGVFERLYLAHLLTRSSREKKEVAERVLHWVRALLNPRLDDAAPSRDLPSLPDPPPLNTAMAPTVHLLVEYFAVEFWNMAVLQRNVGNVTLMKEWLELALSLAEYLGSHSPVLSTILRSKGMFAASTP